jgi:hypothetical protein
LSLCGRKIIIKIVDIWTGVSALTCGWCVPHSISGKQSRSKASRARSRSSIMCASFLLIVVLISGICFHDMG